MKFKKGDTVVCVRNFNISEDYPVEGLTLYKKYNLIEKNDVCVTITDDNGYKHDVNFFRFATLNEFRTMKLNKITDRILKNG